MADSVLSGGKGGDGRGEGALTGATAIEAGGGVGGAGGVGGEGGAGLRRPRKRKRLDLDNDEVEDERVFPRLTIFTVEAVRFA